MKKGIFTICIVLAAIFIISQLMQVRAAENCTPSMETIKLVKDVQTLNLVNGLYLTDSQVKSIKPVVEEAVEAQEEFESKLRKMEGSAAEVLTQMKRELLVRPELSPETEKRCQAMESQINDIRYAYSQDIKNLTEETRGILTENQKLMIKEYQPCLIPNRSSTNPERIGQAGDNSELEKILKMARAVPDEFYPVFKEKALEMPRKMLTLHMGEEEAEKTLKEIGSILDEARAMNDDQFEIKKNELISRIKPDHKSPDPSRELDNKIENFLLNEQCLEALESRNKNL